MNSHFKVHGKLNAKVQGSFLLIEGEGPWNKELLLDAEVRLGDDVNQLYGKPWGVVTIMRGDAMYIPEAEKYLKAFISKEKGLGRVATAVVLDKVENYNFFVDYHTRLYESCGETVQFFEDKASAITWLDGKLKDLT